MRVVVIVAAVLVLAPLALGGVAAVVELPGERSIKERLGFEYEDFRYGACEKVPGDGAPGRWRAEAPLPILEDESRAVTVGNGVYLAGGVGSPTPQGSGTPLRRFERYDVVTRRYERLPDLPIALHHVGVAVHGGFVYVIGGQTAATATRRAFRYSLRARRWEELPSMAEARAAHGVAVVRDRIFVFGGLADLTFGRHGPAVGLVESYDTVTGRWSRVTTMPEARDHLGVATLAGKVYAFAGRKRDLRTIARLDRYDPVTNTWSRLPDAPVSTSGIDLLAGDGVLYTAGGEVPREGRVLGGAWLYRVGAGRWEETAPLPAPRHGYASVLRGDRIYLFGGSTCPGLSPTRTTYSRQLRPA